MERIRMKDGYVNEVFLCGEVSRTDGVKYTPQGKAILKFGLLTMKGKQREYSNVIAWEELAEAAMGIRENSWVKVRGYLKTGDWKDKETGKKMYRTEINATAIEIIGGTEADPPRTPYPEKDLGITDDEVAF
jgi:single-strand DNA-binding protein